MEDEVFGPILLILTYRSPDEAFGRIAAAPHPLAAFPPMRLASRFAVGRSRSPMNSKPLFKTQSAHNQAVDVLAAPFFNVDANRAFLTKLVENIALPAIYESGEYVRSGGLISYRPVFIDMGRRGATLVDKILKGGFAARSLLSRGQP